jgi:outer membrane protein OmpA-like peptidoglycan-associated protein
MANPPKNDASTNTRAARQGPGVPAPGKGSRAPAADVSIGPDHVFVLPRPLRFVGTSARLAPDTAPTLDVIARILQENLEIRRLSIQAHWDGGIPAEAAAKLTQAQADAVRDALIKRGVNADRLVSTGVGAEKPFAPDQKPAERTRNRRIELRVE